MRGSSRGQMAADYWGSTLLLIIGLILIASIWPDFWTIPTGHGGLVTGDELSGADRKQARRMSGIVVALAAVSIAFAIGWTMRGTVDDDQEGQ
jgi:hypothetical protein